MPRRSAHRGRTLILCYHRVADGVEDPYALCVSSARFEAQLRRLLKHGEPATLDELAEPARYPRFVATFDDGYADNLALAAPIARRLGVPLTVYVTSAIVDDARGFWWDRLDAILRHPRAAKAHSAVLDGTRVALALENPRARVATRMRLHTRLRSLPVDEIDDLLTELGNELNVPDEAPLDARPMTTEELRALSLPSSGVAIGAHSVDHTLMGGNGLERQLQMAAESKAALEARIGRGVDHFAYPFGDPRAIDDDSARAAALAGFRSAVTTQPGLAEASPSRYALRRHVVLDWSPARFEVQLRYWGL